MQGLTSKTRFSGIARRAVTGVWAEDLGTWSRFLSILWHGHAYLTFMLGKHCIWNGILALLTSNPNSVTARVGICSEDFSDTERC